MRETLVRKGHVQATSPLNGGPKADFAQAPDDVVVLRDTIDFRVLPNTYRKLQGFLGESDKASTNVFWT